MKTFKLLNFNRRTAMVQADGCTTARQKIGVNPRTTSTIGRFASVLCIILIMLLTLGVGEMKAWQAHGTFNGWAGASMSTSSANSAVVYYSVSGTNVEFKITGDSGWGDNEKGSGSINNDYGNVSLSDASGNIKGGVSGTWYICYHTSDDKVYATTTNPNYPDMVIAGNNFGSPAIGSYSTTATVMSNSSGTYTKTITNVAASSCAFKIVYKGTWTGAKGYDSKKVTATNCSSGPSADGDGNITFTPGAAGSVTITYVQSTGAITIACPQYSVTYDGNGNTSGSVPTDGSSPYNSGSTVTVKGNTGSLAKTGYHFAGWNTAADYSGTDYAASATFSITRPTTLYAKWVRTIYVYDNLSWNSMKLYTWDSNNGDKTYNGAWSGQSLSQIGSTKWYQVDIVSGPNKLILNDGSAQTENITIDSYTPSITEGHSYEIYDASGTKKLREKKLTVTFNMNSHGDAVSSQSVYYNGLVTEPDEPSADHYTFGGWYSNSALTIAWNFSSNRITADKTLYAKWTEVTHAVNATYGSGGSAATPSGWTAMGEVTGGAITATNATGYHFTGWTILDSKGGSFADASSASTTFYPVANDTWVKANFAPNTYSITLDKNGGDSDGSATATYLDDDLAAFSSAARAGYSCDGYFTAADGGTMIIDASGNLQLSQTGYTNASGWTKTTTPTTLYAHWTVNATYYTLHFAKGTSSTFYISSVSAEKTSDGSAISDNASIVSGTGVTVTATPVDHYKIVGWYSAATCASNTRVSTDNPYSFSISANTNLYAKAELMTTTITLDANGGSGGTSSVTATHGSRDLSSSITKPTRSGYTLAGWYTAESGGTKVINSTGYTASSVSGYTDASSNWTYTESTLTLYAHWTEQKKTLTPTVDYNGGATPSPAYTATSANTVGVATTTVLTASEPNAEHYTFAGWTLTNLTVTNGNPASDRSITVKITDYSQAISAVAEYEEVLTQSTWVLKGGTNVTGDSWETEHALTKKTGHSTESVVYYTASISSTNAGNDGSNAYSFKIIKKGASDTWYGLGSGDGEWWYQRSTTPAEQTMTTSSKNIQICADVAGPYEIKVDYSTPASPKVTVTFPTSYTLTYSIGSVVGTDGSISTSPTTTSGSKVLSGNSVTLTAPAAKTGYSWKGWYTDEEGTTGKIDDTNRAITVTMNANKTLYACYTENNYTVTVEATAGGTITTPASPATTVTAHPATTAAIVAEEAEGYYFVNWTTEDAGITIANANNKSTTITATTAGTVTANFAELEKIFFRNENETTGEKLWDVDKMYVYFNVDWADAGDYSGVSTTSGNFAEMNPVSAGSNIFWAYIPRAITTANYTKIAFSDVWMGENEYPDDLYTKFWENNGVYRTDYIMYLNMFVPACKSSNTSNSTTYYSNGYWMKYNTQTDQGASYYLKESTGFGELSEFKVAAPNGNAIYTTYRFENTTAKRFYISNAKGTFYKANSNITSIAYADVEMGEGNGGFLVTPTAEGDYTFTIDQSGDTMKITVKYPISAGDYRLDYTHETSKHLYTDIIKPSTTSSVTTIKKSVYIDPSKTAGVYNNSLKLQKCSGLDGSANPIWTSGVTISLDNFTSGKGVYEFDIEIDNTGKTAAQEVKYVALDNVKLYEGTYYIKTDYAPGGWVNYKRNILTENTINFDKEDSKTFDYYHCAWVGDGGMNVKCIIANEYNQQVTDTLIGDDVLGLDGGKPRQYLETAANVRFSYNSYTNELKRAYINGSSDHHDYYLYLEGTKVDADLSTDGTQSSNSLTDRNNWTYMLNIQAQPGARVRLTAKYGDEEYGVVQSFIGDKTGDLSPSNTVEIMGGDGDDWSNLRVVYDFKTNNLMTAWLVPSGTIESDKEIFADVMIIRKDQGDAEQITFGGSAKKLDEVGMVYSTMQFTFNHIANKKVNGSDSTLVSSEREFYWVSFPHDVLLSDIFGSVGSFYNEWGILYYDGKERAKNGNWADTEGFWKYFTNPNDTLKAFEGYVLVIDLPLVGTVAEAGKWINGVRDLYLYFPSLKEIGNIHKGDTTINIDQTGYKCEIDRRTDKSTPNIDKDRRIADSYWHLIGAPSFKNASHASGNDWDEGKPNISDWSSTSVPFVYEWNKKTDEYTPVTTSSFTFKAMHSYMVQYSGTTITWNSISAPKPVSVARRSPQEETGAYEWRLSLLNGEEEQDRTFIRMTNEEDVTAGFEFNYDLCKEINKNAANIYTFADYVPVAGNVLPMSGQTTVIPVGVKIATNGDYTFSIPEGTEGVGVTLIDKEAGIRTNLSALDYTVSLEAGKNDNRFVLEVSPIHNMPTEIEQTGISNLQSAVKKVLIDGLLYIVRDGKMYDARGARVE